MREQDEDLFRRYPGAWVVLERADGTQIATEPVPLEDLYQAFRQRMMREMERAEREE